MDVIYTTSAMSFSRGCDLSQRASSERRTTGFIGRKPTMPQIFTFEPIRENKRPNRRKRRSLKVLYPPHQVRRSLPTEKDMAKRLLLFLISVVLIQVYGAVEDELSLSSPDLSAATQVSASSPAPSGFSATAVLLDTSPGAEANCTQQPAGGDSLQATGVVRSCRM
ncbi:radiation-inducible immediate-early gene IEX-1-like [Heptranchias perlo]|uniref:radiation-inducible immediate-early gene IEX-1-like n=1 Tax=Heptranchias perlo TaxID=212740 RepID=UPI003559C1B9